MWREWYQRHRRHHRGRTRHHCATPYTYSHRRTHVFTPFFFGHVHAPPLRAQKVGSTVYLNACTVTHFTQVQNCDLLGLGRKVEILTNTCYLHYFSHVEHLGKIVLFITLGIQKRGPNAVPPKVLKNWLPGLAGSGPSGVPRPKWPPRAPTRGPKRLPKRTRKRLFKGPGYKGVLEGLQGATGASK